MHNVPKIPCPFVWIDNDGKTHYCVVKGDHGYHACGCGETTVKT